jgi:hypothetical protein
MIHDPSLFFCLAWLLLLCFSIDLFWKAITLEPKALIITMPEEIINPWCLKSKKELPWYCINVALMTQFASETECQTILWMEPHLSSTSRRETFAAQRRYRTRQTEVGTGRLQVRREAASQTPCSDDPLDLFP